MKRKDVEDIDDDVVFYSPSSKSRRLDAELFATRNEDQRSAIAPQVFDERPLEEQCLTGTTSVMQTDALTMDSLPLGDEKALVLYNPANAPFYRTPSSTDFSVIVNSDFIPGLKDHILSMGNSKSVRLVEDGMAEEKNKEVSNGCLAVVPWVASNWPLAKGAQTQAASQSEPMEAEEAEMMDTDDNGLEASEFGGMVEGSGGLQHRQQQQVHCMEPQLLQNTYNPVTW